VCNLYRCGVWLDGLCGALFISGLLRSIDQTAPAPSHPSHQSTQGGRVVEPGIKGFWRCYSNIQHLLGTELKTSLAAAGGADPLTPYTPSGFYSPQGLEVGVAAVDSVNNRHDSMHCTQLTLSWQHHPTGPGPHLRRPSPPARAGRHLFPYGQPLPKPPPGGSRDGAGAGGAAAGA
jgi:hypothetical protein